MVLASSSSPLLRALTRTWYSPLGRPVKTWERSLAVLSALVQSVQASASKDWEPSVAVRTRVLEAAMLHHVSVYLADGSGACRCRFPRDCQSVVPG